MSFLYLFQKKTAEDNWCRLLQTGCSSCYPTNIVKALLGTQSSDISSPLALSFHDPQTESRQKRHHTTSSPTPLPKYDF